MLYQSTCVGFGYGLRVSYFQEQLPCPKQSSKLGQVTSFVTSHWPRNIYLVPIDYAFRPHLRGRLTLRRLALRRNPWTFGESVSHTLCRYSCQHSHFRYLQDRSRFPFAGIRNALLPFRSQKPEDRSQKASALSDAATCVTIPEASWRSRDTHRAMFAIALRR